jgi:phospholipid/cholesterol/gamma-HCH transport system permease protein
MVPILTIFALVLGLIGAIFIGAVLGKISPLNLLDSIRMFLTAEDMLFIVFKAAIFGVIVAMVACGWGLTTRGGSKELGRSTTAAVVTSTVSVFVSDFFISLILFAR